MIFTSQNGYLARVLFHQGIRPVATDIVVSTDLPLTILDQEESKASLGDPEEFA